MDTQYRDNSNKQISKNLCKFQERLTALFNLENVSQDKIANELTVSRQTFAAYMTAKGRYPDIKIFLMMCQHFNVSPNYLLGFSNIKNDNENQNCYGLSPETINLLHSNKGIHHFFDYFISEMYSQNLDKDIQDIGLHNNVKDIWTTIFPPFILQYVDEAYEMMIDNASYHLSITKESFSICLREKFIFCQPDFQLKCKKNFTKETKQFINAESPNYDTLDPESQYNELIRIISDNLYEYKLTQHAYTSKHQRIDQKIIDIIEKYKLKITIL